MSLERRDLLLGADQQDMMMMMMKKEDEQLPEKNKLPLPAGAGLLIHVQI